MFPEKPGLTTDTSWFAAKSREGLGRRRNDDARLKRFAWSVLLVSCCAHLQRQASATATSPPRPESETPPVDPIALPGTLLSVEVPSTGDDAELHRVARIATEALANVERWGGIRTFTKILVLPSQRELENRTHLWGFRWTHSVARYDVVNLQSPQTWAHSDDEVRQVLVHELTHCAMYQAASEGPTRLQRFPRWFSEGMATWTAGQSPPMSFQELSGYLRSNPLSDPLSEGETRRPREEVVYAAALWAFDRLTYRGIEQIRVLLSTMRNGFTFAEAFHATFNQTLESFEDETVRTFRMNEGLGPPLWRVLDEPR